MADFEKSIECYSLRTLSKLSTIEGKKYIKKYFVKVGNPVSVLFW